MNEYVKEYVRDMQALRHLLNTVDLSAWYANSPDMVEARRLVARYPREARQIMRNIRLGAKE